LTTIPSLIDAHAHIFLHAHTETLTFNQMRDEPLIERDLRATNHIRAAPARGLRTPTATSGTESLGCRR
ncbi:hypothetical protein LTS18_008004, partial [Coniosporium uncinatum]